MDRWKIQPNYISYDMAYNDDCIVQSAMISGIYNQMLRDCSEVKLNLIHANE